MVPLANDPGFRCTPSGLPCYDEKSLMDGGTARNAGFIIAVLGLLLHAHVAIFKAEGGVSSFSLGLMIWSWLPYLAALVLFLVVRRVLIPLGGITLPIVLDVLNYYFVFVSPGSSTAPLALLWMPLWNLLIFMPAGMFVGWILSKMRAR
jgi:hypothetical protein